METTGSLASRFGLAVRLQRFRMLSECPARLTEVRSHLAIRMAAKHTEPLWKPGLV